MEYIERELICVYYRSQLIPDLYDLIGWHALVELIEVFGGITFRLPKKSEFDKMIRDIDIYKSLKDKTSTVDKLRIKYKISGKHIIAIDSKVNKMIKEYKEHKIF